MRKNNLSPSASFLISLARRFGILVADRDNDATEVTPTPVSTPKPSEVTPAPVSTPKPSYEVDPLLVTATKILLGISVARVILQDTSLFLEEVRQVCEAIARLFH